MGGAGRGGNQLLVAPMTGGCPKVPRDRGQTVKGRDTRIHAYSCTRSCLFTTKTHTGSHRYGHTYAFTCVYRTHALIHLG